MTSGSLALMDNGCLSTDFRINGKDFLLGEKSKLIKNYLTTFKMWGMYLRCFNLHISLSFLNNNFIINSYPIVLLTMIFHYGVYEPSSDLGSRGTIGNIVNRKLELIKKLCNYFKFLTFSKIQKWYKQNCGAEINNKYNYILFLW